MAMKDDLLRLIRKTSGLSDRELARQLPPGPPSLARQVNAACLLLVKAGMVRREKRADGFIVNFPTASNADAREPATASKTKAKADQMRTGMSLNWQDAGRATLSASGELTLPTFDKSPGLLRIAIGDDRVVIDSTENLRRSVKNIANPGPKQAASTLVRKQVVKALKDDTTVTLALCTGATLESTGSGQPVDLSDKNKRAALRKLALLIEAALGRQTLKAGG